MLVHSYWPWGNKWKFKYEAEWHQRNYKKVIWHDGKFCQKTVRNRKFKLTSKWKLMTLNHDINDWKIKWQVNENKLKVKNKMIKTTSS